MRYSVYAETPAMRNTTLPLLYNIVPDFLVAGVPVFYFEGDRMVAVPFLK